MSMEIPKFESLIKTLLINNKTYVSHSCEKLLATGENYGSVMLRVEIKLKNDKNVEEIVNCVAKTTPPKGWIWTLFTTVVTFKKEIGFYVDIVPRLQKFLEEKNLQGLCNSSAKYFGSRVTLKPSCDEVDEDAVLLLENLKVGGYAVGDRFTGFDMDVTRFIIKTMAINHAVVIGYRENNPEDFKRYLLPHISAKYNLTAEEESTRNLVKSYMKILQQFAGNLDPYEERIVQNFLQRTNTKDTNPSIYNTLQHNDLWTNNMMIKVEDGKDIDVKFVDLQVMNYEPGSNDLIFFLYTSVQLPILKESIDELIQFYYNCFVDTLNLIELDTGRFTVESFMETVKPACCVQFSHIVKLLSIIFTKVGNAKELTEFSPEDFKPKLENVHENFPDRLHFIISDFIKRNWI